MSSRSVPLSKTDSDTNPLLSHDFASFFKSHLVTICLIFWFTTISIAVITVSIFLIKRMEMQSKRGAPISNIMEGSDMDLSTDSSIIDMITRTAEATNKSLALLRAAAAAANATISNYTVVT